MVTGKVLRVLLFGLVSIGASAAEDATVEGAGGTGGAGETAPAAGGLPRDFEVFLAQVSDPDFSSVIGGIASTMHFNVVRLSELKGADADRLDEALAAHRETLANLQSVLAASPRVTATLQAADLSADQVVWIAGEGEYLMNLYVDDL